MKVHYLTLQEHFDLECEKNGVYVIAGLGTFYWKDGKYHREDGPAREYLDGSKYWEVNGKFHRLDGPAIEDIGFNGMVFYYVDGVEYSKEDYPAAVYMYKNNLEILN